MTYHHLTLEIDGGYCIPRLICTAPPGASCHWWRDLDDELTEHSGCWATSWVEAEGLDGFELDTLLKLPVEVIAQGEESAPLLRILPGSQPA